jgi:hypothetical protein
MLLKRFSYPILFYLGIIQSRSAETPLDAPSQHPLCDAVRNDDEKLVQLLLQDPKIHSVEFKTSPLFYTVMGSNVTIAKILIEEGKFDIHWNDDQLLHTIIAIEDGKMLHLFWGHMTEDSRKDIFKWTLEHGSSEMVSFMLKDLKADPSQFDAFLAAIENYLPANEDYKIAKLLLEDGRADPAINSSFVFSIVVASKKYDLVRLFLEDRRIDPSIRNNAFLWLTTLFAEPADELVMLFLSYPSVVKALPAPLQEFIAHVEEFGSKLKEMTATEFALGFEALHKESLCLPIPMGNPKSLAILRKFVHIYCLNTIQKFYRQFLTHKIAVEVTAKRHNPNKV